jgi:hypothetical protein
VRGLYNSDFEIQAREARRYDADNAGEAEFQQAIEASKAEFIDDQNLPWCPAIIPQCILHKCCYSDCCV